MTGSVFTNIKSGRKKEWKILTWKHLTRNEYHNVNEPIVEITLTPSNDQMQGELKKSEYGFSN